MEVPYLQDHIRLSLKDLRRLWTRPLRRLSARAAEEDQTAA